MNREEIINAIQWELDNTGKEDNKAKAQVILNLCAEYYGYANGKLARLEKKIHEKIESYGIQRIQHGLTKNQLEESLVTSYISILKSLLENEK